MALIKSISGIRGTIGGPSGENLTPLDIVKFTAAYAAYISGGERVKIVVGRDARLSGGMVRDLVAGTLMGCGVDVVDAGLCTTPGVELAVVHYGAAGGIVLTASHNPRQWNALKLLDANGEFLSAEAGAEILRLAETLDNKLSAPLRSRTPSKGCSQPAAGGGVGLTSRDATRFASVDDLGRVVATVDFTDTHIEKVLALPLVDANAIRARRFKIVVDAVNSVGGVVIPRLLERLGCEVVRLNCEPTGEFAHNPEPLPENLSEISARVVAEKADLGVVVDPDVDRLALVNEDGSMFGEEYTLVAVADYVLSRTPLVKSDGGEGPDGEGGKNSRNTVSNLSSTRALRDVTERLGGQYFASAVGEVNVVAEMKRVGAVIGGEGNGGVIYPASHYGRDALVGIALFLSHLARKSLTMTQLRATYPDYHISKNRLDLTPETDIDAMFARVEQAFSGEAGTLAGVEKITDIDGVKIDFVPENPAAQGRWVHLRRSNTEPIIRVYSEAADRTSADDLARKIIEKLKS